MIFNAVPIISVKGNEEQVFSGGRKVHRSDQYIYSITTKFFWALQSIIFPKILGEVSLLTSWKARSQTTHSTYWNTQGGDANQILDTDNSYK